MAGPASPVSSKTRSTPSKPRNTASRTAAKPGSKESPPDPTDVGSKTAADPAWTDDRRALGALGETRAARFLARRGYRIVARNVRAGGVEMDLVVQRGRLFAFVEVKTRRTSTHGAPELAVDERKQARLVRAAAAWLRENPRAARAARAVRFDVVTCRVAAGVKPSEDGERGWQIDHWPGAFDASGL